MKSDIEIAHDGSLIPVARMPGGLGLDPDGSERCGRPLAAGGIDLVNGEIEGLFW